MSEGIKGIFLSLLSNEFSKSILINGFIINRVISGYVYYICARIRIPMHNDVPPFA